MSEGVRLRANDGRRRSPWLNFPERTLFNWVKKSDIGCQGSVSKQFISEEDVSTPELIRLMAEAMGRKVRLFSFPPVMLKTMGKITGKSAEIDRLIGSLCVDSSKIRTMLGWKPPYAPEEGIRETAEWCLKSADYPNTIFRLCPGFSRGTTPVSSTGFVPAFHGELRGRRGRRRHACHCELARQPSPPGIRLRRSRWRTGKARRPGARAGRLTQINDNERREKIM